MSHINRLRRWCEPVREDTPQLPLDRQDRVTVSKSDLLQLLADYDASTKNELLMQFLAHAWDAQIKYHRDNTVREFKITVRDTCTMNPHNVKRLADLIREFVDTAPGAGL